MPNLNDLQAWFEQQVGHPVYGDEGCMWGDPAREVTGVSFSWFASPDNMRAARAAGHNLLIHHEALVYPYPMGNIVGTAQLHWFTNQNRFRTLVETDLTTARWHTSADELCVFDGCAQALGLTHEIARGQTVYHRVFEIEPTPYLELVEHCKKVFNLPAVRTTSVKPDRIVRKVGMPWGGLGLFVNVSYVQELMALVGDIDVMIAGETDNYAMRFCTELGIDVIETSHELSENPGIGLLAQKCAAAFPGVNVRHLADPCVWQAR